MRNLTKSEIVYYVFDCLIRVVGRRNTTSFAIVTINTILKQLESKYDHLKNIEIDCKVYSEGWIAVSVDPEINSIETKKLGESIGEIIEMLSRSLGDEADYYFIREIRDELKYEIESLLKKFGVDLNITQFEYAIKRKEEKKFEIIIIENSKIIEPILKTLIILLEKIYLKVEAVNVINIHLKELETTYDFLKHIKITNEPGMESFYTISISPDIDEITSIKVGKCFEQLLQTIGKSVEWTEHRSFIESFEMEFGRTDLLKMKEMGIKLDHINTILKRQGHKKITQKVLDTLFILLSERTSKDIALKTLETIIKNLQNEYVIFQYVIIDYYKVNEETNVFNVMPEVNLLESYKLGTGFREIIKIIHDTYGDRTFITEFKEEIGDKALSEIEKMGVNLHFLELRFA